jgi:peptidoglycan/xylan/chitin deacetylase (PgdA/CDA1 family)
LQYRYAEKHGLCVLALVAVVLVSFGGQRGDAAPVLPSSALEESAVEPVVLPTASQWPASVEIIRAPLSELEETRADILNLRSLLSNRGGRESASPPAPIATATATAVVPAIVTTTITATVVTAVVPAIVTTSITATVVTAVVPAIVPITVTAIVPVRPSGPVVVPILMYHHIAVAGPTADTIRRDLSVSPANFAAQMSYLARNGYHTLSVEDLVDCMATGRPLPPSPIVLTFDDGYLDNYTNAFPVLKSFGFAGTFFIITDFAGKGEHMTWDQAVEMTAWGMDLESHTLDHPDLAVLPASRLSRQLSESRAIMEQKLGKPVRYLSYPSGRYNAAVMRAAAQAGYAGAVTTVYGDSHALGSQFELTRIRVRGADNLHSFARKVNGPVPGSAGDARDARMFEGE